ncbi:MAG: hypothetical protein NVSMB49_07250 [Ktedonobacteraceae bacterium]
MQTVSTDQLVGQTIGLYNVKNLLGRGRLSAVYLVQHPTQKHTAALTTFIIPERFTAETRTRFVQRFTREAADLTALSHRNLLPIHEYGEQFGYPYLITPYMTHGSLADVLKQRGRCTSTYVLEVLEQVAAGLDYAHRKGIIHGTLKPSNILLGTDQNLLVSGFGLVHMLQMRGLEQNDQPYSYLLSIADTFLYASTYIAPEVVQGQPIDARSDIYALGVVLFELLSGKPPFTGNSPLDTAMQHVQYSLPSLHKLCPDIPIAMELVVNHALARDPSQRFQHVSELVEAFSQVCKGIINRSQNNLGNDIATLIGEQKSSNDLQNVPEEAVSFGGWQLTPPIITGKLVTARVSAKHTIAQAQVSQSVPTTTDLWQIIPPIITGRMAAVRPSQQVPAMKEPAVQPPAAQKPSTASLPQSVAQTDTTTARTQSPTQRYEQSVPATQPAQQPLSGEPMLNDADAMNTPTWWIQEPSSIAASTVPKAPEAPLLLPDPEQKKPIEQNNLLPQSDRVTRIRSPKLSRSRGRRRVIATIAVGSVVVASTLIAGKMNIAHLLTPFTSQTAPRSTATPGQQKQTGNGGTSKGGGNPGKTGAGHTGNVLGATTLATNASTDIINPADGKAGLLIHLPNGHFVAYERACTHEGVAVNYDPATHTLVCPAHGAVFDPLNNAAVLQGPAMRPLKSVAFRVNADGTITA